MVCQNGLLRELWDGLSKWSFEGAMGWSVKMKYISNFSRKTNL